ncbi:Focadhesin, partial [Geodia barretti]
PTQSLPSLSQFLSSLLPSEVEAVPRGTISSVLRQSWVQSPLERAVKGVENLLLGMCVVNSGRDSPHGMVASTALMLCAMASSTEQAESQNRRGHIALKEMKKYTALLEDALTNGHVSLDCDGGEGSGGVVPAISCLVLPRRWALFMKKVCDCFTMVWLTRNCPASIWDNSSALEEKLLKARDWANRELTSKFTEVLRKTPTSSSNVLFALMGVVCSSLLSPTGSSETQTGKHAAARSCTEFLLLTITHIQCVIKGSEVEHSVNSPVSILLSDLKECVDVSEVVLVCPLLIETALAWTSLSSSPTTTFRALEDFVLCLWSHFNASPTWCCGIVMNEILLAMLPRMSQGEAIDAQLVDFAEASQQSQSFEYQTVVSSLVPTLIFMKHADHSLGVLHHLKALLEILGPEQLEMEQPQIVSINYVNSCRLLYLNGVVSDPDAMECVTHIADLATKAPHVAVYHFCLGSLIYGLMASGHPTVDDLADSIAVRWIQQLSDQTSTNELLVTMWGLAGLIGVNPTYDTMWYKDELSLLTFVDTLFPLLRDFLGKLANEENPVVGVHATWILGCTYHRLTALFSSMERVPKDYSYLPEGTLLPTLLSYVTDSRADIRQVKCLLSALLSVSDPLPPCDMGSVLFPFVKSSELQMTCVQLVINQSSHVGTKILAGHIMNLMLAGSLMTEAELQVLENLSSFVPLLPAAWKYLQPLTTLLLKLYPTSQKHLQSFLMSVNDSVTSGTTTTTTTKSLGYSEKEMIQQVWERICGCGCTVEIFSTDGKLLLRLVAECLAATGYVPISFDASVPVVRTAFECLLQACWVDSGTRGVSNLCKIMHWTLQHYGLLENGIQRALMETLVEVIRHVSSVGASQKSLVIQTELLHSLLAWTRTKQPSVSQMQLVLFLCTVVASPTPPGLTTHPSLDLVQWLASFSLPDTPVLQEKTLQCLVEWFAYSHEDVHEICLSKKIKLCDEC